MIHIFAGTKAELIKIAPIMRELKNRKLEYNFIWSGQHKDTIDKILENFEIKKPDIYLYEGKDITQVTQMFFWFWKVLIKSLFNKKKILRGKKGIIFVHGDTVSTVLGAIFGKLAGLKVAHFESGLTSGKLFRPMPEEIDRRIVFKFTDFYFCPNQWTIDNLKKYNGKKINTFQNTLYDSVNLFINSENKKEEHIPKFKYALCSLHRFENIYSKSKFIQLIQLLEKTAEKTKILFIMHKNTEENLKKFNLYKRLKNNKNFEIRPRYDYFDFIQLINKSEFFISDGGSNQEESSYLGIPTIILRSETERIEGLGKNVVITNYNFYVVEEFIKNYKNYKYKLLKMDETPSKLVVEYIIKNKLEK